MNSNTEKQAQTGLNDGSLRRQTDSSLAPAAEGSRGSGRAGRSQMQQVQGAETRQWTDEGRALGPWSTHTPLPGVDEHCHKGTATQCGQLIALIKSCIQTPNIEFYPFIIGNYHKHFQNTFRAK